MKNKKNHIKVNLLNKNNHKRNYCNIWGPTGAQSLSPEATPGVLPGSNCIAIVWQLSGNCLAAPPPPTGAQSLSPEGTPGVLPGSNCIAIVWQLSGNCLADFSSKSKFSIYFIIFLYF